MRAAFHASHQRPPSVEADIAALQSLRIATRTENKVVHQLIELERRQRAAIDDEWLRLLEGPMANEARRSHIYFMYLATQREKQEAQIQKTAQVRDLFRTSRASEKEVRLQQEKARQLQTNLTAATLKQELLQQRLKLLEHQSKHQEERHDEVWSQRLTTRQNRLLQQHQELVNRRVRIHEYSHERTLARREHVAERAAVLHERRAHVAASRAASTSPTLFLKLPPMRSVIHSREPSDIQKAAIPALLYNSMLRAAGGNSSMTFNPHQSTRSQSSMAELMYSGTNRLTSDVGAGTS